MLKIVSSSSIGEVTFTGKKTGFSIDRKCSMLNNHYCSREKKAAKRTENVQEGFECIRCNRKRLRLQLSKALKGGEVGSAEPSGSGRDTSTQICLTDSLAKKERA